MHCTCTAHAHTIQSIPAARSRGGARRCAAAAPHRGAPCRARTPRPRARTTRRASVPRAGGARRVRGSCPGACVDGLGWCVHVLDRLVHARHGAARADEELDETAHARLHHLRAQPRRRVELRVGLPREVVDAAWQLVDAIVPQLGMHLEHVQSVHVENRRRAPRRAAAAVRAPRVAHVLPQRRLRH
eukprot:scaffold27008_cov67-Phaeocystis_antarctica.AAC.5